MAFRDTLNENKRVTAGICAGLIVCGLIVWYLQGGIRLGGERAYYTIDDGKSWFADQAAKLPPFEYDGKQAVRAYVFECNGKRFVNSLERYTPEGLQAAQLAKVAPGGSIRGPGTPKASPTLKEVKRPGQSVWVAQHDYGKSGAILAIKCPDGGTGDITPIEP